MIDPTDPKETMPPESRLRLGKVVSVDCIVKVRDIGMVVPEHRLKLLEYYQQEQDNGFEPDEYAETPRIRVPSSFTQGRYGAAAAFGQGASCAPSGSAYNTYPASTREAHGSYPSHSGYHGESQTHGVYPPN
jgi:hypothetical protein